jgi:hypothetical protein
VVCAASAECLNEFAGFLESQMGSGDVVRGSRFLRGEEGPDGGGVVHVVGEEGSELRGEGV